MVDEDKVEAKLNLPAMKDIKFEGKNLSKTFSLAKTFETLDTLKNLDTLENVEEVKAIKEKVDMLPIAGEVTADILELLPKSIKKLGLNADCNSKEFKKNGKTFLLNCSVCPTNMSELASNCTVTWK